MSGWKALPDALELDVRRFVEELRRTKDSAGLTLAQLAEATAYSKSSWERCLNGSRLPPSRAVEALAARAGTDPEQLLARWELAEAAWSDRGGTGREDSAAGAGETEAAGQTGVSDRPVTAPGSTAPGSTPPGRGRRPTGRAVAVALGAVLTVAGALAAFAFAGGATSQENGSREGADASKLPVEDVRVSCHGDSCNGKDPVDKGCGGDAWTSAGERVGKSYVELRYSSACRAAWARIKSATPGDRIELVRKDERRYDEVVPDDPNLAAFTFMLGAPTPQQVRACWELKSGDEGCTDFGGTEELPAASPVPS